MGDDGTGDRRIRMDSVKKTLSNLYLVLRIVFPLGLISLIAVAVGTRPFVMISESMHPKVPKNSHVLMNTLSGMDNFSAGHNIVYVLGSAEALHKVSSITFDATKIVVKS